MRRGGIRAVISCGAIGAFGRVSISGPERIQLRKSSGGWAAGKGQGSLMGSRAGETCWGRDGAACREVQTCQTIEGSWQTGSFQSEIERLHLEGCRKRITPCLGWGWREIGPVRRPRIETGRQSHLNIIAAGLSFVLLLLRYLPGTEIKQWLSYLAL